jgi:DtxR family transcriptional regulator, Mn-dependent transcriptional regulator
VLPPKLYGVVSKQEGSDGRDDGQSQQALSAVAQDYLKVIWTAQEWSQEKVSTKLLSERIGVSASTVSEAIRKLADQGLVDHAKYGSITLTEEGRVAAVGMVRRHRLLETFLVHELGYGWDEVHDEAEILEHAVSDLLMSRIDAKLGFPARDPHGDPIPSVDGAVPTPPARQLSDFADGEAGRVARISDSDPAMLRYFDSVGIALDTTISVVERRDYAGTVSIRIGPDSADPIDLGSPAAQAIWLTTT